MSDASCRSGNPQCEAPSKRSSINTCFSNVSHKVLSILAPDIIIFSAGFSIDAAVIKPIPLNERRTRSGDKSREISPLEIKEEVKDKLSKKARYFYMGHYAYIKQEDYRDAEIIKNQIASST